jgi:Mrp family chromosome partitioning ATPase
MAKRQVVDVVSQKGGVGKSTLCQLIAREAAASGKQAKILAPRTRLPTRNRGRAGQEHRSGAARREIADGNPPNVGDS